MGKCTLPITAFLNTLTTFILDYSNTKALSGLLNLPRYTRKIAFFLTRVILKQKKAKQYISCRYIARFRILHT
jgi:hypothetical protein